MGAEEAVARAFLRAFCRVRRLWHEASSDQRELEGTGRTGWCPVRSTFHPARRPPEALPSPLIGRWPMAAAGDQWQSILACPFFLFVPRSSFPLLPLLFFSSLVAGVDKQTALNTRLDTSTRGHLKDPRVVFIRFFSAYLPRATTTVAPA